MKVERESRKCIICKQESRHNIIYSYLESGSPDLDLRRPYGVSLHQRIQECPHCHYCNYDISEAIQTRFKLESASEIWKNYSEVQEIIAAENNPEVRKCLVMAKLFEGNLEPENVYNCLIGAAWVTNSENQYKELMQNATDIFVKEVLPEKTTQILQMVDIARKAGEFEISNVLASAVESLAQINLPEAEIFKKVATFQKELNAQKDVGVHNMEELPK